MQQKEKNQINGKNILRDWYANYTEHLSFGLLNFYLQANQL